ncbi:hypothetical protein [Eudoraea chungangensis]|uniref:hypothetical protein n=1 Tax=Eudoraea chungangensis TaxID=1481905 RepID=UPI0023EB3161|nr:hypothetical protein [Eudoraea chungangensis]
MIIEPNAKFFMTDYHKERSSFIKKSHGILVASKLPLSVATMSLSSKYKMGLPLFTIRDAMQANPLLSL